MIKKWLISLIIAVAIVSPATLYAVGCHYFPTLWDVTQRMWGIDELASISDIINKSITLFIATTLTTNIAMWLIEEDMIKESKDNEVNKDEKE